MSVIRRKNVVDRNHATTFVKPDRQIVNERTDKAVGLEQ